MGLRTLSALALLTPLAGAQTVTLSNDLAACLVEAERANTYHALEAERAVLEHAETLEGSRIDAATVQRRLAVLDWKYGSAFEPARERLLRATEGADAVKAWLALARMEFEREDFPAARTAARGALRTAKTELDRKNARGHLSQAAVEEALLARLAGEAGRSAELEAAHADLADFVTADPGYLTPSRQLLRSSLLLDDGPTALAAWRSYFHVRAGSPPPNAIAAAGAELERILPGWGGDETVSERIELVAALGASRMFTEAWLVAADPRAGAAVDADEGVRGVVAYARYVRGLRSFTEDYYRDVANGVADHKAYRRAWEERTADVWAETEGEKARRFRTAMFGDLERRFGTHVMRSSGTSPAYDVFMGHAVIDEVRDVEQYGQRAELRFVAVDNMVSNGFASWAWENGGMSGGWGGKEGMWQVRPGYVGAPLAHWRQLQSKEELARFVNEMERESARDDARARNDPHAYLPGLALRLEHQGRMRLFDRLQGDGLRGDDLRLAFLAAHESAVQESSIFAHEGRHAIDARRPGGPSSAWRSEFTAKLSQIAFAPEPRLAFGGILFANIGDESGHGRANLEVVKGYVAWMEENRADIEGFEEDRPVLPQLDRLTDEQLRAGARSMDPLAKKM